MKEKRIYQFKDLEVRGATEGHPAEIRGHAAVFNSLSVDLGGFVEMLEPGAFRDSLAADPDVRATIDHEGGVHILGRTKSNTLFLEEDARGLHVRIFPPETQAARDIMTLMQRGDIDQMSFVFRAVEQEWEQRAGDVPLRRLQAVNIDGGDVSIVTYPAYEDTHVSVEARDMARTMTNNPRPDEVNENEAQQRQARHAARERKLNLMKRRMS